MSNSNSWHSTQSTYLSGLGVTTSLDHTTYPGWVLDYSASGHKIMWTLAYYAKMSKSITLETHYRETERVYDIVRGMGVADARMSEFEVGEEGIWIREIRFTGGLPCPLK